MTEPRSLLLVGRLRPERKRSLTGMAIAAELPLVPLDESADALAWLESNDPGCVIVDAGIVRLDKVIGRVRSKRELAHVPIFALVTTPDDLWIEQYFAWGGDDVVQMEAGATLLERLRAVPREVPKPVANRRAVVAEPDRIRSEVLSRVFNLAGFDVRAASDIRALEGAIKEFEPTVVIVNSAMGELANLIAQARKGRSRPSWAVLAARREFESQQAAFAGFPGVFVVGVQTNPWQLLSRANEFGRTTGPERRREPRRPVGSFVLFRAAGGDEDEVGIAYNLSSRGMFVRTYAPVQTDEVWLEWRVPQDKTRVRLAGKVVWRQASLTDSARVASPLGFGIEFSDYLGGSRKHLEQALEVLDNASKRATAAGGAGAPSSARKTPSGPPPASAGTESRRPVSLEPDAWELEANDEPALSAPAALGAPLPAMVESKLQPKVLPKPPSEKANVELGPASTSGMGVKLEGVSAESDLKRPPPGPPPSVKASARQVPRPNTPPRPVPAPASVPGSVGALAPAGTGQARSQVAVQPSGEALARESSDDLFGPRTPRGGLLAPAAPRVASLPMSAGASTTTGALAGTSTMMGLGALAGTSTMMGLGAPPAAWLPADRQASNALKSADADAPRAAGSIASRGATAQRLDAGSAEDGPSSSDTTEILNNPTALFEIAADSIPPLQDANDDAPTVVTPQILDSSATVSDAAAADATPVLSPPASELRATESRFGADELETRRWSGLSAPGQSAEPDPVSSAPFSVSERAKSGAGRGKIVIGAGALVLVGVAALAYWLSSSKAPKATTQVAAPSAVVVPQSGAPSAVPVSSAVASGGAASIVLPTTQEAKPAAGEIPFAPLDDGTALDGYPPVEEFQMGKGRLLADRYGYLVVRFPEAAFIFANGIAMGTTNWKIATTCGEKTLRIGIGEKPVTWLSEEMRVNVLCRDSTRVVFRKLPGVTAPAGVQRPMLPGSGPARKSAPAEGEQRASERGGVTDQPEAAPNVPAPAAPNVPAPAAPNVPAPAAPNVPAPAAPNVPAPAATLAPSAPQPAVNAAERPARGIVETRE